MPDKILTSLVSLWIPPECLTPLCAGTRLEGLSHCRKCWREIRAAMTLDDPQATDEKEALPHIFALLNLNPIIKNCIHGLKYQSQRRNGRVLTELLRYHHSLLKNLGGFDLIVPVPLHPVRKRERGYNQSDIIGAVLSRQLGAPMDPKALMRVRYTQTQTHKGSEGRRTNLNQAFRSKDPNKIRDRQILLVDDVCTTGSTLEECRKTLLASGAARVEGFALARACETSPDRDYALEKEMLMSFAF